MPPVVATRLLLLILSLLLSLIAPARAAPVVAVSPQTTGLDLARALESRLAAPDASLEQVLADRRDAWRANPRGLSNFGHSDQALWLHVRLRGLDNLSERAFIRHGYPNTDFLDYWVLQEGRIIAHHQGGDRRPFAVRPVADRLFLFPLPPAAGELDVYLRLASQGPLEAPLSLVTAPQASEDEQQSLFWIGLYFGVIVIMVLYNGIILAMVRNRTYAYYILYVISCGVLQFLLFGLGFRYLWPESTTLNNTLTMLTPAVVFASAIAFVIHFVDLPRNGARFELMTARLLLGISALLLVSALTLPYAVTLGGYKLMMFLSVAMGFYLGVKYWLKGLKSARIFALAWFSYLVFILVYLLELSGWIAANGVTRNALAIGSAVELALLSLAFADKMNEEKDKRLLAQNTLLDVQMQMNADLDRKVRERTEALELANRQLQEVSVTDGLTRIKNRRFFEDASHAEYQRAYREKTPLSVLMIDIDHFKRLNDTYGHPFGDLCLQRAAEMITTALKRLPDMAARYGGEEFVVLLPNTSPEGALTVAQQIHRSFANHVISDGAHSVTMSVCIGVAGETPEDRDGRERLLKQADDYLYIAKKTGRNKVVWAGNADEAGEGGRC
jgi:diguanylate cyclase (GGDEF)-like protein